MAEHPTNRPVGKRATREALIQAGMVELAEQGLQEPSLDAICARAGFTRGAFYVHFEDREDFVAAVMERVLGGFLDAILAKGSHEQDLAQAVQLDRLIEVCTRSPRIRERWAALVREASERMAKSVLEGQVAGRVRADATAEQIGALLLSLALGTVVAVESGAPFDPALVRDAVLMLLRAPPATGARRGG